MLIEGGPQGKIESTTAISAFAPLSDGDRLTHSEACYAGDEDFGCIRFGGGVHCGGSGGAYRSDYSGFQLRARADHDFSPASKPPTLATLRLVAPTVEATDIVVVAWVWKSAQLLPVSAPSGKRPALAVTVRAEAKGLSPPEAPGAGAKPTAFSTPETA